MSLWASVPHYVAAASPNPKAALELVRRLEGIAGVAVDAGELEDAAVEYERQVNAAVASDPDVKAFVEKLEAEADEYPTAATRAPRPARPATPWPRTSRSSSGSRARASYFSAAGQMIR